jgi:hypothetical protein
MVEKTSRLFSLMSLRGYTAMSNVEKVEPTDQVTQVSGRVTSTNGIPIKGVRILCKGIETKTLADGRYVLTNLPTQKSQTLKVIATLQGYTSTAKEITIQKGTESTLNFNLSKAAGTARIHGYVCDLKSKKKIDNASAVLILPVSNMYQRTDKNGRYEFNLLPPGLYRIRMSALGYQDTITEFSLTDDEEREQDFFLQAQKSLEPPWG